MITPEYCKEFVQKRLGVPNTPFELTDEDLNFWLHYTIKEFSRYIPRRVTTTVNRDTCRTEEANVYFIPLPDAEIIAVVNVFVRYQDALIAGHPYRFFPSPSWEDLGLFFMRSDVASASYKYSFLFFTYDFIPPDKIRITPSVSDNYLLDLEVYHRQDLASIPPEFSTIFLKMYLKNVIRPIASIRNMYSRISTPFNEIELNADQLENLANQIEEEIKETLENINPGILMIRG